MSRRTWCQHLCNTFIRLFILLLS